MSHSSKEMSATEWRQLEQLQRKAALSLSPTKDSEDFQIVSAEETGAMTDGSKRRGDDVTVPGPSRPKLTTAVLGMSGESERHSVPTATYAANAGYVGHTCFPNPMSSELPSEWELPPGVPSVERWGDTLIDFGRFKGANMTYSEAFHNSDSAIQEYVQWSSSRTKETHGLLSDFARYVNTMRKRFPVSAAQQGPVIPGSQHVRRFR